MKDLSSQGWELLKLTDRERFSFWCDFFACRIAAGRTKVRGGCEPGRRGMAGLRRAHPAVSSRSAERMRVRAVGLCAPSHVGRHQSVPRCHRVITTLHTNSYQTYHCAPVFSVGSDINNSPVFVFTLKSFR